jgi:hypothetical protein
MIAVAFVWKIGEIFAFNQFKRGSEFEEFCSDNCDELKLLGIKIIPV